MTIDKTHVCPAPLNGGTTCQAYRTGEWVDLASGAQVATCAIGHVVHQDAWYPNHTVSNLRLNLKTIAGDGGIYRLK